MKFHLHRHSSRIKSLVFILLLSLVGQAWAVSAVCTMTGMTNVDMANSEIAERSPCHTMSSLSSDDARAEVVSADSTAIYSMSMDCCDSSSDTTNQHDCSCPDSGCSATFTMAVGFTSAVHIVHEQAVHYSTIHFLNRISTSLYRPPIA
jgi:hypothetical protein